MARRLPSLNALKAFESAARHISFTLAAAELNVTHAAISRHIRELETSLGISLFERTGRGVVLTEEGLALARELTQAFDLLHQATERFSGPRDRRQLVISAEVSFASLWLVPRLGRLAALHPEIDLVLDPTNRLVDFSKAEADLAIRYGKGNWRDIEAMKLIDAEFAPVCSPGLIKKQSIKHPRDLATATLLQDEDKRHWIDWLEAAGVADRVKPTGPTLKGHLVIAAAEAGQGFALADAVQAADAIANRRLVRPFEATVCRGAYYIVRPVGAKVSGASAAFSKWVQTEMAETRSMLSKL